MFEVTSESVQRWIRVGLYTGFGALANHGMTVSSGVKEMVIAGAGILGTIVWTMYGSRVNAMLTEISKTDGIQKVDVKVDPTIIKPADISKATPDNVTAKST